MVYCGDCLEKMKELEDKSVDLVYVDPPFYTQAIQKLSDKNGHEYSFTDSWKDIGYYINISKPD